MKTLLLWLMLGQALTGLHSMAPGTAVQLAPPNLFPPYDSAVVEDGKLVFTHILEPETEVRVLIFPPGASDRETEEAVAEALYGRIGPTGNDIYVLFEGAKQAVSFKKWLFEEFNIELLFTPSGE